MAARGVEELESGEYSAGFDKPLLGGGERPCNCCAKPFKMTMWRRMLCQPCYRGCDKGIGSLKHFMKMTP